MALAVLTPSTTYNIFTSYFLCKKIRKIDLRSQIFKNTAKMVKKGGKWSNFAKNSQTQNGQDGFFSSDQICNQQVI